MADNIKELNIQTLFNGDKYVIPIYQRNYAWGNKEITQLIQDIADYAFVNNQTNYYIGTLVVYERLNNQKLIYETIDGQQRLTTLNILLSVIKREYTTVLRSGKEFKLNIEFANRPISTETLEALFADTKNILYQDHKAYNPDIRQAYEEVSKALKKIVTESGGGTSFEEAIKKFFTYLIRKVFILRVSVPQDTDLNHYFEIMNSRGEQLEKHEVLKAYMLEVLKYDKDLSYAFNLIWEACADMERYVQYGFTIQQRCLLFGKEWNTLELQDLYSIAESLAPLEEESYESVERELSIAEIIVSREFFLDKSDHKDEAPERFTTLVSFSNFLLHVLLVQTQSPEVSLDDKRLLEFFEVYLNTKEDNLKFVIEFGYNLLRCKFLFDKYIIKREFLKDKDQWSLKRLKLYKDNKVSYVNTFGDEEEDEGENKRILMILAMFHVSAPALVYKHWLNAALQFVFLSEKTSAKEYLAYLEKLAQAFLFNRFLAREPQDYFDIIYTNRASCARVEIDESRLNQGVAVENFIFNYLDYLLWKDEPGKFKDFEFTFRSSVEHYYPQNPIDGHFTIAEDKLHHFGNLCLISASKNARLSNHLPTAKKDYYTRVGIDSLKQKLMMAEDNWGEKEILEHGKVMKKKLIP
jgi:hypothetical protein